MDYESKRRISLAITAWMCAQPDLWGASPQMELHVNGKRLARAARVSGRAVVFAHCYEPERLRLRDLLRILDVLGLELECWPRMYSRPPTA